MSISDVAFLYVFTYVLIEIGDASLEKCWETFYKEVFLRDEAGKSNCCI